MPVGETHITHTAEETRELAKRFLVALGRGEVNRGSSTIVALSGELGAGKTVFTQGVASALGVIDRVTSPTYVLQKVYQLPQGALWRHLVHIDAYRLSGEEDLKTLGWHDVATNMHNLIIIEWPEQVGGGVPERAYEVRFDEVDEVTRRITILHKGA